MGAGCHLSLFVGSRLEEILIIFLLFKSLTRASEHSCNKQNDKNIHVMRGYYLKTGGKHDGFAGP